VARRYAQPGKRDAQTDGAIAAVLLNSCQNPRLGRPPGAPMQGPGPTRRLVRRVILSARNHYFRNNLVWEAVDLTRAGVRWAHRRKEAKQEPPAATEVALRSASGKVE
jgi:hypothetical protein